MYSLHSQHVLIQAATLQGLSRQVAVAAMLGGTTLIAKGTAVTKTNPAPVSSQASARDRIKMDREIYQ